MTGSRCSGSVVILGAGHAGGRTAIALREAGHAGPITLIGEEPRLPYERPMLSKELLLGSATLPKPVHAAEAYRDAGIQVETGRRCLGLASDRKWLSFADGADLTYDRLVIATGGRPRRIEALHDQPTPIHYLRTLEDALRLRDGLAAGGRVLIVGGGVIGLEVAAAACRRGCAVTIVEAGTQLMGRGVPASVAAWIGALHRDQGTEIHLGATVEAVGGGLAVSNGARIVADMIVVGVGIEPNLDFAAGCGIADPMGIVVDPDGRSAVEDIFAVGDIALQYTPGAGQLRRVETWANAEQQPVAVARAMCGTGGGYNAVPWFWSDQFDFNLQVVGDPEGDLEIIRGDPKSGAFASLIYQDGALVGAATVNRARDMMAIKRLLAAGCSPDPQDVANENTDLRRLLPRSGPDRRTALVN